MAKKHKKYDEESFMFMPINRRDTPEKQIQEWVEETRIQLIDKKEPFFYIGSGSSIVVGFVMGKKKEREYRIIVVRDGYEEITITPKP